MNVDSLQTADPEALQGIANQLLSQAKGKGKSKGKKGKGKGKQKGNQSGSPCPICNRSGHTRSECWYLAAGQSPPQQSPSKGRGTVGFHNFKSQNFKLSVSNPKSKYVAYVSVLSQISNCQGLSRKSKFENLKTDRQGGGGKRKGKGVRASAGRADKPGMSHRSAPDVGVTCVRWAMVTAPRHGTGRPSSQLSISMIPTR